jgi:hypothetical protein
MRLSVPHDQRTASTYIFCGVCPKGGQGRGADPTSPQHRGMNLHLTEIAKTFPPTSPFSSYCRNAPSSTPSRLRLRKLCSDIATRLIPNRLHARVLHALQADRPMSFRQLPSGLLDAEDGVGFWCDRGSSVTFSLHSSGSKLY